MVEQKKDDDGGGGDDGDDGVKVNGENDDFDYKNE